MCKGDLEPIDAIDISDIFEGVPQTNAAHHSKRYIQRSTVFLLVPVDYVCPVISVRLVKTVTARKKNKSAAK